MQRKRDRSKKQKEIVTEKFENVYIKHKRNIYFYPRQDLGSYSSVITLNSDSGIDLKNGTGDSHKITGVEPATYTNTTSNEYKILKLYYTALGRERYSMRRVTNSPFPTTLEPQAN